MDQENHTTGEESKVPCMSGNSQQEEDEDDDVYHIVIIGAGLAGLACARKLLSETKKDAKTKKMHVTIIEATDRVGGRIRTSQFGDIGAEIVHCRGHEVDHWIQDYQKRGLLPQGGESYFVLSHGDGGPQESPTTDQGKYGMYYMQKELIMYNDERVQPLQDVLESLSTKQYDITDSFDDALKGANLSSDLYNLCLAGYGNTAGCGDLSKLSISQILHFEHYWETHEIEGDYTPPSGMYALIEVTLDLLRQHDNFKLQLNSPVEDVRNDDNDDGKVEIRYLQQDNNEKSVSVLRANAVVVTVPPPILPTILELTAPKLRALEYVGFERACKIICKFTRPFWPDKIQSIICADGDLPEIWFHHEMEQNYWTATGFLVSVAADRFVAKITASDDNNSNIKGDRQSMAAELLIRQLSEVWTVTEQEIIEAHTDSLFYDWKDDHPFVRGGYMFPKVGMTPEHLQALAEPMGHIFFAGEATHTRACCTVQAALQTGNRAADQVMKELSLASS